MLRFNDNPTNNDTPDLLETTYVHPQHIVYSNPHSVAEVDQLIPRCITLTDDMKEIES